jgi:ABC-type dipeptide/oligopeptide/nickel transport system ATPase component
MRFPQDASVRVIFMDHGVVVEAGPPATDFAAPAHEPTREFMRQVVERSGVGGVLAATLGQQFRWTWP